MFQNMYFSSSKISAAAGQQKNLQLKKYNLTLRCPKYLMSNVSMKVLEKLPLCEEIPHEKSYLNLKW
jgi:hypothetical protein